MNSMFPQYTTKLFTEVWESESDFRDDYLANPLQGVSASDPDNLTTIYYLLYAKYGNSPIANFDVNQFKAKVFGIMWQYGPSWEKRLDIQAKLRALSEDDIIKGAKAIYNHAYNPSQAPSTSTLEEIDYINDQNTTNYKKSKMEAYAQLWDLIDTDVTQEFINRFKVCFKTFVAPERPLIYVSEDEDYDG